MSLDRHVITVQRDISAPARAAAADFRNEMTLQGTLVVNLMSSPGAGKTSLLEATARHWRGERNVAVLVGDIATDRDALRLSSWMPVVQLTTGGACHLELPLVQRGLEALDSFGLEYLFIENVGNLVCPASHDLGEHRRIVMLSTTEGDDKPGKYPKAFRTSHALLISKIDLIRHLPFSVDAAQRDARDIQPSLDVFALSALTGEGITQWCEYLDRQRGALMKGTSRPIQP